MNTSPNTASFSRAIYRDFAWFALAAIGVGLAVSLTLTTAIVLSAPHRDTTIDTPPISESPYLPDTQIM
jgi:hypothetical protein